MNAILLQLKSVEKWGRGVSVQHIQSGIICTQMASVNSIEINWLDKWWWLNWFEISSKCMKESLPRSMIDRERARTHSKWKEWKQQTVHNISHRVELNRIRLNIHLQDRDFSVSFDDLTCNSYWYFISFYLILCESFILKWKEAKRRSSDVFDVICLSIARFIQSNTIAAYAHSQRAECCRCILDW